MRPVIYPTAGRKAYPLFIWLPDKYAENVFLLKYDLSYCHRDTALNVVVIVRAFSYHLKPLKMAAG